MVSRLCNAPVGGCGGGGSQSLIMDGDYEDGVVFHKWVELGEQTAKKVEPFLAIGSNSATCQPH